ncbi:hypothetical protein FHW12_004141 [Dokdonella fugitiva]|uniref:Uncharacterized protein n=1 Tax=Dokdonella fugitiva TaxID=328517 RepID=A0A839FCV0_9GAMM|nr:hypothetical protein [Dokdonella fugitiva]MBA8889894.1 hypothetical protein [Dokdonella fugitiva]
MAEEAVPEDLGRWQRRLASQANNRAWTLAEMPQRSTDEDAQMLHAAHAAMYFWTIVGTPDNHAHAALLLAHVYALLKRPESAAQCLGEAWPHFTQPDLAPWELAFAHAVAANVAAAKGDAATHARHYAEAKVFAARMIDAKARDLFDATLRVVPMP